MFRCRLFLYFLSLTIFYVSNVKKLAPVMFIYCLFIQVRLQFGMLKLIKEICLQSFKPSWKSQLQKGKWSLLFILNILMVLNILYLQLWLLQKSREDSSHSWGWWRNMWTLCGRSLVYSPGAGPLPRWTPFLFDKVITNEASVIYIIYKVNY